MTDEELRALDAEIHRTVFGRRCELMTPPTNPNFPLKGWFDLDAKESGSEEPVRHYSTDDAAASLVLVAWDGDVQMRRQNGQWNCKLFRLSEQWDAWGETFAEAVCRARLKAVAPTT